MILDAQYLIDAHESEGFDFDQALSTEDWYMFERNRDDVHCAHGVFNLESHFVFESDHVISDDSGDPALAEALRVYFERIWAGGDGPREGSR